jgi:hypothetical protein
MRRKGYDYDQVMDNKPRETIATGILTLCPVEMSSAIFAK